MLAAHTGLRGGSDINTVDDLENYICDNESVQAMMNSPKGKCHDCAVVVQEMLNDKGIKNLTRAMYIWNNKNDNCPQTHYVVIAKLGNNKIAIDPTGAQFANVDANIAPIKEWASDFRLGFRSSTIIKFNDFNNLSDSRGSVHSFFEGKPDSYSGTEL